MKKLITLLSITILFSGCASTKTIQPVPSFNSNYRTTKEVRLISCVTRNTEDKQYHLYNPYQSNRSKPITEVISVVETIDTGERFEVIGCYGNINDRFKISF